MATLAGSKCSAAAWSIRACCATAASTRNATPASRLAWASSASRCCVTASTDLRAFFENDVRFLRQFALVPCQKNGHQSMKILRKLAARTRGDRADHERAGRAPEHDRPRSRKRRSRRRESAPASSSARIVECAKHPEADRLQVCQGRRGQRRQCSDRLVARRMRVPD